MIRPAILMLAALALAGCGTTKALPKGIKVETVDIAIPVAVACAKDPGPPPVFPDDDDAALAKLKPAERYKAVIVGRDLRKAWIGELEPIRKNCTTP
jgi:hypothetical protein